MIPFSTLSAFDQDVIRQAIRALLDSGIYSDRDYDNRCGAKKAAFLSALDRWPQLDDSRDENDDLYVINGTLAEICHGLEFPRGRWDEWFTVSAQVLEEVYARWEAALANRTTGEPGA